MEVGNTSTSLDGFVQAAARGDRDAFANLVQKTANLVSSIALAIVGDLELSRDIAQDVFLATWRELGRIREPSSFLPWLRQTTRNQAHQALRGRIRRRRVISNDEAEELLAAATDPRPTINELLVEEEDQQRLASAIESLPDATREVVTLYYREGRSARQVGDLLGLREATVKQRLSRARANLRESLLDELGQTLAATKPGAAFTGAVMLALAAPTTASAAGVATTASKVAGASKALPWTTFFTGTALGAIGGVCGVLFGTRRLLANARDAQERAALQRFTAVNIAVVLLAVAAFPITWHLTESIWSQWATLASFIAILAVMRIGWLPRILGRRFQAERLENPAGAKVARRREGRYALLGWSLGVLAGTLGLLVAMWMQGS